VNATAILMPVVLAVPGLAWSFVLLDRRHAGGLERVAVAVGLSIVIVPLTAALLGMSVRLPVALFSTTLVALALAALPGLWLWSKRRG